MRVLFLGDVVGRAGRQAVIDQLPGLRERYELDFVIVNGDNAAGGFGITEEILNSFLDAGADVVTGGDHIWDQRDALVFIERQPNLLRPVNFPAGVPGRGVGLYQTQKGQSVLVVHAVGRVFMPEMDCPFAAVDREISQSPLGEVADAILIDFHAEATSEKQAMGHFVDGRASLVVGTHTHAPTSDARVLPNGTAFQTDAGMCGCYDSVIGMEAGEPIERFVSRVPRGRFQPSMGDVTLAGFCVEIDDKTGLAVEAKELRLGGHLSRSEPLFWVSS
ncbi:MAG: metallophosphoesterase [Rhodomicrobium sp.]|nr:MAG: metallophosphoesterase [Rhodomicrobium sp.]